MTTDAETVQPALSPEQWQQLEVEFGDEGWAHIEGVFAVTPTPAPVLVTDDLYVGTYDEAGEAKGGGLSLAPPHRHALAALCLYGRDFGFTGEDIDFLRAMAAYWQKHGGFGASIDGVCYMDADARSQSIAARIAALLPPK